MRSPHHPTNKTISTTAITDKMQAYTIADSSGAVLARLERMHEAYNDSRARVANGMAERDGAPMDVDLARVKSEELLSGLDDDGKCLVDFE